MSHTHQPVSSEEIEHFHRDGAVCIRGLLRGWEDVIAAGIERNIREPGPYAADYLSADQTGRFFDDYCNWTSIPEFEQVIRESPAASAAAALMKSKTAQFFHDHVLVKEPGTAKATPWHQDSPYYFVGGEQTVSFWIPIDPVKDATLRLIAGSHLWDKPVLPVRWVNDEKFYGDAGDYLPIPNPDEDDSLRVVEWQMEPGDVVAFDFRTVHGARGNPTGARRRVLSLRWMGDDARYIARPGPTSPPYTGHGMEPGQTLRQDLFPTIFTQ